MRDLVRIAKPGGWVVVTTPNQLSWLSLATLIVNQRFSAFTDTCYPVHRTALLESDLRRMAGECHLEKVAVHYSHWGRLPNTPRHYPHALARRFPRAPGWCPVVVARGNPPPTGLPHFCNSSGAWFVVSLCLIESIALASFSSFRGDGSGGALGVRIEHPRKVIRRKDDPLGVVEVVQGDDLRMAVSKRGRQARQPHGETEPEHQEGRRHSTRGGRPDLHAAFPIRAGSSSRLRMQRARPENRFSRSRRRADKPAPMAPW